MVIMCAHYTSVSQTKCDGAFTPLCLCVKLKEEKLYRKESENVSESVYTNI